MVNCKARPLLQPAAMHAMIALQSMLSVARVCIQHVCIQHSCVGRALVAAPVHATEWRLEETWRGACCRCDTVSNLRSAWMLTSLAWASVTGWESFQGCRECEARVELSRQPAAG